MKCFLAVGSLVLAAAGEPALPPTPLTLSPAAAPSPARKYTLLPDLLERTSGDAAEHYKKAKEALKDALSKEEIGAQQEWRDKLAGWLELPLDEFPKEEARDFLKRWEPVLKEIDAAARCEHCDFGHAERLRKAGIGANIQEIQDLRDFVQPVALRARLETAEGKYDRALRSLRAGYAMARHANESPTLISALVGNALAAIMTSRVEELVQQPGAPNLYWAMAELPRPFISLRPGLQGERLSIYGYFGQAEAADDPAAEPLPAEAIPPLVDRMTAELPPPFNTKELVGVAIASRHETAKRALIAQGRPKEIVDKMPHVQVAVLHALLQYDRELDEFAKLADAPYVEAKPAMLEAESRRLKYEKASDGPVLPFARYFLPAIQRVFASQTRLDRRLAAVRTVEAIRLYAAAHDGKLPPTLGAIKEVSVPNDPLTGKPFDYGTSGDKGTLTGAEMPNEKPNKNNTISYELTIKR
jgi:hypothetical protein